MRIGMALLLFLTACAGTRNDNEDATRMETDTIVYIQADYDAVWERLTTAEGYAGWYSMGGRVFATEPGGAVEWGTADRVLILGKLDAIEKGRGFVHTFQFRGLGFDDEPTSLVTWTVEQQGPVVLVRVRHVAQRAPETMAMIGDVGWPKALNRLKTLLETGKPMPWPEEPVGAEAPASGS
ncbi:MAG: SRPBCC domain-containing protein [Planctomycetota bacterium]